MANAAPAAADAITGRPVHVPCRRDLRGLPGVPHTAPRGPWPQRDAPHRGRRARRDAPRAAPGRGRHARRLRPRPGDPLVPERPLARVQDRGRRPRRPPRPVPRGRGGDRRARGSPLWAMVELEADDALATGALPLRGRPRCRAGPRLHARQGPRAGGCAAAAVGPPRPAARPPYCDEHPQWGVSARSGLPGFGAVAASTLLATFDSLEGVRAAPPDSWPDRIRGGARLAATLAERWADAILFRDLATLRLDAPLPERRPTSSAGTGRGGTPGRRSAPAGSCRAYGSGRAAGAPRSARGGCRPTSRRGRCPTRAGRGATPARAGARGEPRGARAGPRQAHAPGGCREIEAWAAGQVRDLGARALGDRPAAAAPRREADRLAEGVEAAVGDVGEGQGGRAHLARDPDGAPDASRAQGGRSSAHRKAHDEVHEALLGRDDHRPAVERGRPVGRGGVRLRAHRVVDDADDGVAVDDKGERDAEERDRVGIVDGPVDGVADPGSVGGGGVAPDSSP